MEDMEIIGILGQLLDDNEDDVEMSEKVRKGISDVYTALCFRQFECKEANKND